MGVTVFVVGNFIIKLFDADEFLKFNYSSKSKSDYCIN